MTKNQMFKKLKHWNLFGAWCLKFGASATAKRRGFTLLEILIVIAIIAVLSMIIVTSFSRYTGSQALSGVAGAIGSALGDARSRTLSSQGGSQYGVHLASGDITLFQGTTYDVNDSDNETTPLDTRIAVTPSLSGGGSDIVFERLTGETDDHGTITLTLNGTTLSKTIVIQQTGFFSIDE